MIDKISVLIVDDHTIVRDGLPDLSNAEPGMQVIGVGSNGVEAVEQARLLNPDVILLDLHMPDMSGSEVQLELQNRGIHTPVVIITGHATPSAYSPAFANGASAYICKPIDASDLLGAVHGALQRLHA